MEVRMRPDQFVLLLQGQNASVVSQRMDNDSGVLARLDNLVEIADRAVADRIGQWSIVPDCAIGVEQETADEVGGGHVLVAGDGDQRFFQAPGHEFDETGLAAAGRAFQHHRHARLMGRLEQRDLGANRLVIGLLANAIVVQIGHKLTRFLEKKWPRPKPDPEDVRVLTELATTKGPEHSLRTTMLRTAARYSQGGSDSPGQPILSGGPG